MAFPRVDTGEKLLVGQWYEAPSAPDSLGGRVGLTAQPYVLAEKHGVLVLGGANHEKAFGDAHFLNIESYSWEETPWEDLPPRYEHTAFQEDKVNAPLFVFAGAQPKRNLNTVHQLDVEAGKWCGVVARGTPPSPRTFHMSGNTVCHKNHLFVFGGGAKGAQPVDDQHLHILDLDTLTWEQPPVTGECPVSRHGHVMAVIDNKLYLHGGLSGTSLFDDLHCLDLGDLSWSQPTTFGSTPAARSAHTGCGVGKHLLIFGGLGSMSVHNDLCLLDTVTLQWMSVCLRGPPISRRLDHAMCVIKVPRKVHLEDRDAFSKQPMDVPTTGKDDQRLVSVLSASGENTPAPLSLSKIFPDVEEDGQWVLCVIGGVDMNGKMFDKLALLPLT